ncbi:MAG: hypothetical protein J0M10_13640 [Chitinophagales bacterium]|nr:hypothetical protein [Chitinophagales bacterium]
MKKVLLICLLFMSAGILQAQPGKNNVLIVLQENTGKLSFTPEIPEPFRTTLDKVVDGLAENFENFKTKLQLADRYEKVILLTDVACTRANLLNHLIAQTKLGKTVDLLVLGHGGSTQDGSTFFLVLKNELLPESDATLKFGGVSKSYKGIRSLITDARAREGSGFNFNLRLVYMCNCKGGNTNDAWISIGAKTAVGSVNNNYMPEPQITYFFNDFVINGKTALQAANDSWSASRPFYSVIPYMQQIENGMTRIDCSKMKVDGNTALRFAASKLGVNESKSFVIKAGEAYNHTTLFMSAGEKYQFTVSGTDLWKNSSTETTANGYQPGILDGARRQSGYNMMTLVGEIFRDFNNTSYTGTHFKIGTSRTYTAAISGYLMCHANDVLIGYGDNTGQVSMTVKRIE